MRLWSLASASLVAALASGGCLTHILSGGEPTARDFVSGDTYHKWVVEVDSVQGQAPSGGVLDALKSRLAAVADKPSGIDIVMDETLPAHGGSWSDKDVQQTAAAHSSQHTSGDTVVLHLLFLDGNSARDSGDGKVLGEAIGHGTIAIFAQTVRSSCDALCLEGPDYVMQVVLVHEFGHAMGLVNNGIPMVTPHEDASHPAHSSNCDSVMYWAVETTAILNFNCFGQTRPPSDFDANDRKDLHAAGGK